MIIYGAGAEFRKAMQAHLGLARFVECVIDRDKEKQGTTLSGIFVNSPTYLKELRSGERIYISTDRYFDEICTEIRRAYPELHCERLSAFFDALHESPRQPLQQKILYRNAKRERETYRADKDAYLVHDDAFLERYRRLAKGLDGESVETVNRILSRLELLFSTEADTLDIFNDEEQVQLQRVSEELNQSIYSFKSYPHIHVYKTNFLPERYFDNGVWFYQYGLSELSTWKGQLKGDVIDCGAFIGDSSLMFSQLTSGHVLAIEPQSENCKKIAETIRMNNVKNIEIVEAGLGAENGSGTLYHHDIANWGTMMPYESRDYSGEETIRVRTIDDIVRERCARVDLIKADIEGMESDMLRGAVQTLRAQRPLLVICLHHTARDFWGIKPFLEDLDLGYKFQIFKKTDGNILTGTFLLAEIPEK